jgi:hypothetical protein
LVDWNGFLRRLRSFPSHTQKLRPPCGRERVLEEEQRLGQMPSDLAEMLYSFNGGELFVDAIPFVTVFGLSLGTDKAMSDWFIDRFTPSWRSGPGKPKDWAIGMRNYGGLVVLGDDLLVREWDTSEKKWAADQFRLDEWIENIMKEGAACLEDIY